MTLPQSDEPAGRSNSGDRERAFDALFRAHYQALCRFVTRMLGSREQAEDVVQEVFLYVWERHEVIAEGTPSRAYLYRAVHNAALNRVRRQQVETRFAERAAGVEQEAESPVSVALEYEHLVAAVQHAIDRLPARSRLVYTMSRQDQLSYQEIATALGLSVKTVEAQMARAFRLLRKALGPFVGVVVAVVGG